MDTPCQVCPWEVALGRTLEPGLWRPTLYTGSVSWKGNGLVGCVGRADRCRAAGVAQNQGWGEGRNTTPPGSIDSKSVMRNGNSQHSHHTKCTRCLASAFLSRTPSELGKASGAPLVLRHLIVYSTTVSSSAPPPRKYVSVSQVPASSYYRNRSSFPYIFVSQLIRSWERKPFVCSGRCPCTVEP